MIKFLKDVLGTDIQKYYFNELKAEEKGYLDIVSNYIQYYHYRAWGCKHWFYFLNFVKLFALAGVPIFRVVDILEDISIYAVCASAGSILIEGIIALTNLQEKWLLYRNTSNCLMSEVRKFVTSYGKYEDKEKRFSRFVEAVENMIGDEARNWNEKIHNKQDEKTDDYEHKKVSEKEEYI